MPGREFCVGVCGCSPACPAGAEPLISHGFGSTDRVLSSEIFPALEDVWIMSQTVGTWLAVQKSRIPAPEQVSFSLGAVALLAAKSQRHRSVPGWTCGSAVQGLPRHSPQRRFLSLLSSWLPGGRICSFPPCWLQPLRAIT